MTLRRILLAAAFAIASIATSTQGFAQAQRSAPQPAQIDRNGVLILIRSSLIALQQANETGNYTVLRDLGAPAFQRANTAARLSEVFTDLRGRNLDLSGILVLDPQLTLLPQIEANGFMHMAGFFPSVPTQINFELLYAPTEGRWRLYGISVKLGSSTPVAPTPAPAAPPQVAAKPKPAPAIPKHKRTKPAAAEAPAAPAPENP